MQSSFVLELGFVNKITAHLISTVEYHKLTTSFVFFFVSFFLPFKTIQNRCLKNCTTYSLSFQCNCVQSRTGTMCDSNFQMANYQPVVIANAEFIRNKKSIFSHEFLILKIRRVNFIVDLNILDLNTSKINYGENIHLKLERSYCLCWMHLPKKKISCRSSICVCASK